MPLRQADSFSEQNEMPFQLEVFRRMNSNQNVNRGRMFLRERSYFPDLNLMAENLFYL